MSRGYKVNLYQVAWTHSAEEQLQLVLAYLAENWSEVQENKLIHMLETTIANIEKNPRLYPKVDNEYPLPVHKVNVLRFNSLYYSINDEKRQVVILAFFSNRQNPKSLKF